MADILIRGMEMPKNETFYVELQIWGDGTVYKRRGLAGKLEQIGTAIPLQEGHGRLIDADAYHSPEDLNNAPTIVPAEGGEADGNP